MKRRVRLLLVVVALSSFGCIPKRVNWREVNAPADQSTLLHLPAGDVIGFTEQDGTLAWLGMPYAQAPVGPLRWKAPRPAARFDLLGFSATRYGPDCPQRSTDGTLSGDEACLTLNVASRSLTEQRRPVVVWLHDGDEGTGTANTWGFIRRMALRHNVVLVGVNYRLGNQRASTSRRSTRRSSSPRPPTCCSPKRCRRRSTISGTVRRRSRSATRRASRRGNSSG